MTMRLLLGRQQKKKKKQTAIGPAIHKAEVHVEILEKAPEQNQEWNTIAIIGVSLELSRCS